MEERHPQYGFAPVTLGAMTLGDCNFRARVRAKVRARG